MYAETDRERLSILESIRASEWNAEMNPVSLTTIEPGVINHDFSERSVSINTQALESVSSCLTGRAKSQ
jgi:hypothetical protein